MTVVHVVVPDGIDDPARRSGGNVYDRRVCDGLSAAGWSVYEHVVPGSWPRSDAAARASLARLLGRVPDGGLVLLDGLIASGVPEVLVPQARRLRLVVLVHMPIAGDRESQVLHAATAVVTTSAWTRRQLLDTYGLPPDRVHVAEPGAERAPLAPGTAAGGELLCVAAVAPHKGHDVLLAALAKVADASWRCVCVGSLDRDRVFADRLRSHARDDGLGDRMRFTGVLTGEHLSGAYARADVLVLATRGETYGMVVTEALAHGLPVIASSVGGLPEALGHAGDGSRPGLLVPPDDPAALSAALDDWLGDGSLRQRLRSAARDRRATLTDWSTTTARLAGVLRAAAR